MVETMLPHEPTPEANPDVSPASVTWTDRGEVGGLWLVTGYAVYKRVAVDSRFSADHFRPGYPSVFPVRRGVTRNEQKQWRTYSGMDGQDHAAHRRLVAPEFTARRIAELRPRIQRVVGHCLARLFAARDTADLARDFAAPIAVQVICSVLGVPENRINAWTRYSDVLLGDGTDRAAVAAASSNFRRELALFITEKEASPADDLTSRLIGTYRRAPDYAPEQIVEFVGAIFLAGLKSTASMIALGAMTLLEAPDAARLVASGEPGATTVVVDELLRFHSIADRVTARVATELVKIGDHTICPGDGVVASSASANRDPTVFADPETFDASRACRHHVAFGYGPHRCLGEHLARLQIDIALSALFSRFPNLTFAEGYPRPGIDESGVFRSLNAALMIASQPNGR